MIAVITALFAFTNVCSPQTEIRNEKPKYVIAVHGGAGSFSKTSPDSIKNEYLKGIQEALKIGLSILENGGTSIDAVEKTIIYLEDNELFNAGKGSVFNSEGYAELDASIMNGADLSCGAATGVRFIKNPIRIARVVMENTPHVLFNSEGAEKLADIFNIEKVEEDYFKDSDSYRRWKEKHGKKGTVGAVALDIYGNLAAGTSTGGTRNKMPGRIGDSPIIGAGTYANNNTCAVSCTGIGEKFIKNFVAANISALMEYKNLSLKEAADEVVYKKLSPDDGGIISADKDGNVVMEFNSESMLRGFADSNGNFDVKIWK